jgi:hypothetical protein
MNRGLPAKAENEGARPALISNLDRRRWALAAQRDGSDVQD